MSVVVDDIRWERESGELNRRGDGDAGGYVLTLD